MTRFMWWTVVWFGLALIERIVIYHYIGWERYHAYYSEGALGVSALLHLALWIALWFLIIRFE